MHKQKITGKLQEQWELAIERAAESKELPSEMGEPQLQEAAGLNLKSRVRVGVGSLLGTTICPTNNPCSS